MNNVTSRKQLTDILDPLSVEIVSILLEEKKPLRNFEVAEKLKDKSRRNDETKRIIGKSEDDSLRVQVTNRLQRLWKNNVIKKKILSPKNVQYWITKVEHAREQVEKEVFKQSLGGLRFQKVGLESETEKVVEELAANERDRAEKLLSRSERRALRDPARAALWETATLEGVRIVSEPCKVYLVYPTDVLMPTIDKEDIRQFYKTFLKKSLSRSKKIGATAKSGFSVLFQYEPPQSREKGEYEKQEKVCLRSWLRAMNVETLSLGMGSKYQQDKKFVSSLLNKTVSA